VSELSFGNDINITWTASVSQSDIPDTNLTDILDSVFDSAPTDAPHAGRLDDTLYTSVVIPLAMSDVPTFLFDLSGGTDDTTTTDPKVAIHEELKFRTTVTLPDGTSDIQVHFQLPYDARGTLVEPSHVSFAVVSRSASITQASLPQLLFTQSDLTHNPLLEPDFYTLDFNTIEPHRCK
jgi:hypothetical protein